MGTGAVFTILTNFRGSRSAYVPTISYGCDISGDAETCNESGRCFNFFFESLESMPYITYVYSIHILENLAWFNGVLWNISMF